MSRVESADANRLRVEPGPQETRFVVPARRQWFVVLFLPVWLVGWFFGFRSATGELTSGQAEVFGFMGLWLAGWTLGGLWAAGTLLWMLFGREVLTVRAGRLERHVGVFGLGRSRAYDLARVDGLRWTAGVRSRWNRRNGFDRMVDRGLGAMQFEYGARTVTLARETDRGEGLWLVDRIAKAARPFDVRGAGQATGRTPHGARAA